MNKFIFVVFAVISIAAMCNAAELPFKLPSFGKGAGQAPSFPKVGGRNMTWNHTGQAPSFLKVGGRNMTWNHTDHHSGAFNGSAFNRTGDHKFHHSFSLPTGNASAPNGLPSLLQFQKIHKRDANGTNSTEGSSKRHNPNDSHEENDQKDSSAEKKSATEKSGKAKDQLKKTDKAKKNKTVNAATANAPVVA